jgi:predicted transcriptional regulator
MTLDELRTALDLEVKAGSAGLGREATGGYASDLLSDVIANAQEGDVWVTLHRHPNIVAVAVSGGLAGIVLVGGREPDESTVAKAETEGVPILVSHLPTFELVAKLHGMGISGKR